MTKKELRKLLTPGRWVKIWWKDSEPAIGLLLDKPDWGPGDVSLHLFYPDVLESNYHASHDQVIGIGPGANWIELTKMKFSDVSGQFDKLEREKDRLTFI